jgi:hypothetical protein
MAYRTNQKSNNAHMGSAPILLDRAEVRAYMDRIDRGITSLQQAVSEKWQAEPKSMPSEWYYDFLSFKANWGEFYEKMQGFDLFGPTVWSAYETTEGYETQYRSYKKDFETRFNGKVSTTGPVTPADIEKEHPSFFTGWTANSTVLPLAGAAILAVVLLTRK